MYLPGVRRRSTTECFYRVPTTPSFGCGCCLNNAHRFDIWIAGSVFVLFVLGVILAAHC
jgi:hypothetical protein